MATEQGDRPVARAHASAGAWSGAATDTATLGYDDRLLRRKALTADGGLRFVVDLPKATELVEGDALMLEDGRAIAIRAAAEPLLEARAEDGRHLLRIAWHLGNRHHPTEILADRVRIRIDPVMADLLTRLGAVVSRLDAPFRPEGGAYGAGRAMGHDHGHSHSNDHAHTHTHDADAG